MRPHVHHEAPTIPDAPRHQNLRDIDRFCVSFCFLQELQRVVVLTECNCAIDLRCAVGEQWDKAGDWGDRFPGLRQALKAHWSSGAIALLASFTTLQRCDGLMAGWEIMGCLCLLHQPDGMFVNESCSCL
jgi:hypothetical protein